MFQGGISKQPVACKLPILCTAFVWLAHLLCSKNALHCASFFFSKLRSHFWAGRAWWNVFPNAINCTFLCLLNSSVNEGISFCSKAPSGIWAVISSPQNLRLAATAFLLHEKNVMCGLPALCYSLDWLGVDWFHFCIAPTPTLGFCDSHMTAATQEGFSACLY